MSSDLYSELEKALSVTGSSNVLVSGELRLTGEELLDQIDRYSSQLDKNNCQSGSLIVLKAGSRVDFVIALLACAKAKLVVAPLSVELPEGKYIEAVERLKPDYEWCLAEQTIQSTQFEDKKPEPFVELASEGGFVRFTSGTTVSYTHLTLPTICSV